MVVFKYANSSTANTFLDSVLQGIWCPLCSRVTYLVWDTGLPMYSEACDGDVLQ